MSSAGASSLLGNLLGAFIGQGSLPTPNQGAYTIDPETGEVVLPYNKASLGTRMFHPDIAQQMGQANAQAATLLPQEQLQDTSRIQQAANRATIARSGMGLDTGRMNPTQLGVLGATDAAGLNQVQGLSTGYRLGNPDVAAQDANALLGNNLRQATKEGFLGTPEANASLADIQAR